MGITKTEAGLMSEYGVENHFRNNKLKMKMSECLRTYGPQIIRVPQLQIED